LILALVVILTSCNFPSLNDGNGNLTEETTTAETENDNESSSESEKNDNEDSETSGSGEGATTNDEDETVIDKDCNNHSDVDDDGKCDLCAFSVIVYVDLYAINDLHGKFCTTEENVGVEGLSTYLKNATESDDHTIFLSSGDMWQGGPESNLTSGFIVTDWMNELDFAAMTLGNHEFDWGEEKIEENAALAEFPLLAINVYDRATNERVEYCSPSVVVDLGDIQIGIIGAIGDCYSSISSDKTEDVYFKVGSELTALVKSETERLRSIGADYIVYSVHDGYGRSSGNTIQIGSGSISSYYDVALSEGYVDLVFESHTHQNYVMVDSCGVYHLQGGGDNRGLSHVEVKINSANGNSGVNVAEYVSSNKYSSLQEDEVVDKLLEKYSDEISKSNLIVGMNDRTRSSSEIKQLVAKLYYETGAAEWGDDYDIVLGGGFMSVRSPYSLPMGEVTYGILNTLLPFDNRIVLCSIKGGDLKKKFLETNNDNYYIHLGEYGEQIKDQIKDNDTYYVIVDTYSAFYAPNNLTVVAEYDPSIFARDLVAEFITKGGWTASVEAGTKTIRELLDIGSSLANNAETDVAYYVEADISSIENWTYGNLWLTDGTDDIYVYGLSGADGSRYDSISDKPVAGDRVLLKSRIKKYVGSDGNAIIELYNAVLLEKYD